MSRIFKQLLLVTLVAVGSSSCTQNAETPKPKASGSDDQSRAKAQLNTPKHTQAAVKQKAEADTRLLTYLDHLLTEYYVRKWSGGSSGRLLQNKSEILGKDGSIIQLDRSYSYDSNGIGTVTDKSRSRHQASEALTFRNDMVEKIDQMGRPLTIKGSVTLSNGQTIQVERSYIYDANGLATVTDKSIVTQDGRTATTFRCELIETINQVGKSLGVQGTVTDSDGRVRKVSRK